MTAAAAGPPQPSRRPFADATPAQIRDALGDEEAAEFARQWRNVMDRAKDRHDLSEVHEVLEAWRRIAWLTRELGPGWLPTPRTALVPASAPRGACRGASSGPSSACREGRSGATMSYEINIDLRAHDDIAALPIVAEAITFLQLTPRNAAPINPDNPSGPVRTLAFGDAGLATILILEVIERVDLLTVAWGR